jgi:Mg2+ and Co2+ transporter CorA
MKELEKIDRKLEKIDERLDNIDKHLAVYNSQLRFHIKRTDMLEEDMKPLKIHLNKTQGILTFIGVVATVITVVITLLNAGVLNGR